MSIRLKSEERAFFEARYDLIVPLGTACLCAITLNENRLRFRSLPFDWVSGGNIISRSQLIATQFRDWLSYSQLEYVGEQDGDRHVKDIYRNKLTDIHFVHDFTKGCDFDEQYKQVVSKYERRIARLYDLFKKSRRILFVWMDYPVTEESIPDADLCQAYEVLRTVNPSASVSLLYLHNNSQVPLEHRVYESPAPGICKEAFDYGIPHSDRHDSVKRKVLKKFFSHLKISFHHMSLMDILRRYRIFYIKKDRRNGLASVRFLRIPIWKYRLREHNDLCRKNK